LSGVLFLLVESSSGSQVGKQLKSEYFNPRGAAMPEYHVHAFWDDEAKTWVGTSEDVPGLCVESRTLEELMQTAGELIPELLVLNGVLPQGDTNPVPFRVTAERSALARVCRWEAGSIPIYPSG
jgi:predicted RNase H-like HicB family nuclease